MLDLAELRVAFTEIVVIVQIPVVRRNAEEAGHIFRPHHFLCSDQHLKELFAMPRSDDRRAKVGVLQLQHSLRQSLDGRSGGLLHKQVSLLAVRKGIKNEVDGITERHHEAGHIGIRDRQGLPLVDLVAEQRDDRAAGSHDVAVSGQAQNRISGQHLPGAGDHILLHDGLRHAHGIDGISRLVRRQEDCLLHMVFHTGRDHIVRTGHVGFDRFHGVKLAGGYLLEGGSVEHIIHPAERRGDGTVVPHITYVEFDFLCVLRIQLLIGVAHVVLFFLIAGKNTNLADIRGQKAIQNRMPEGAGAARDEENLMFKQRHF